MKQIITFIAIVACSFTVSAQSGKTSSSQDQVVMKQGKVFISNGGKMSQLKADFTSANGTMFKPDGTVIFNTGATETLKEGESMGLDGRKQEAAPATQATKPVIKK